MEIMIEVDNDAASSGHLTPKPNLLEFQKLFASWGTHTDVLQTLRIHITFCRTECRGEYFGCRDGVHHIELKDMYLLVSVPQNFLEKATIHELRHIFWALQENPPDGLGEEDCIKIEEKLAPGLLWNLERSTALST